LTDPDADDARADFRLNVGRRIREARLSAGLSEQQLRERAELSKHLLESWESGDHCPSAVNLAALAHALEISAERFFRD
jgi:ribosome-binding protein aMBF1 (putative translation factor)